MGAGSSHGRLSPPEKILADPEGPAHFVCIRSGSGSHNCAVYKEKIRNDCLWLAVQKEGYTLQPPALSPAQLTLMSFTSGILAVARLQPRRDGPNFPTYNVGSPVWLQAEPTAIRQGKTRFERITTIGTHGVAWDFHGKANLFRSVGDKLLAEVVVEARGSAHRTVEKFEGRDSENLHIERLQFKEKREIDFLKCRIRFENSNEIMVTCQNPNSVNPTWECAMFYAAVVPSDDWRWKWDIKTRAGYDPSAALLCGLAAMLKQVVQTVADYLPGGQRVAQPETDTPPADSLTAADSPSQVTGEGTTDHGTESAPQRTGNPQDFNSAQNVGSQAEALSAAPGYAGDQAIGRGQETAPGAVGSPLDEPPEKSAGEMEAKEGEGGEGPDPKHHPGPLWGTPGTVPDVPPKRLLNHGVELPHP